MPGQIRSWGFVARVARSAMYRGLGLLCYDPASEKAVDKELITAPPDKLVIDPDVTGFYDPLIERIVPRDDPAIVPFNLDHLLGNLNGQAVPTPVDRYDLALAMLSPGTGLCLDACTPVPLPAVRTRVELLGYRYLAVDLQRSPHCQQEDLTALTFRDNTIARIISCDTLEHVPDYPQALREMLRVLMPGGTAIIHVPVYHFDRAKGTPIIPGADPWGHVRYLSANEMVRLFAETGFGVARVHYNFDYGGLLCVLAKKAG